MARNRSGAALIDDAMIRADVEGAEDRHPRTEVLRHINQGRAEFRDLVIEARGVSYFRSSTPWQFVTTADTIIYTGGFPPNFLRMVAVRVEGGCGCSVTGLEQMQPLEEPELLDPAICGGTPSHYDLRPNGIAIYPRHDAGLLVTVEFIPSSADILDSTSSYADGYDGWEDYVVEYAARKILLKDGETADARECAEEMKRLTARISRGARNRDAYRPKRVQDVRGARMFGRMRGGR